MYSAKLPSHVQEEPNLLKALLESLTVAIREPNADRPNFSTATKVPELFTNKNDAISFSSSQSHPRMLSLFEILIVASLRPNCPVFGLNSSTITTDLLPLNIT